MRKVFREMLLFGIVVCMGLLPFSLAQASHAGSRIDEANAHVQFNPASYSEIGHNHRYSNRRHRRHHYSRNHGSYDCHPVSKHGYDRHGYPARIGGTMCYDHYGNPYVVSGSRYIIGRY